MPLNDFWARPRDGGETIRMMIRMMDRLKSQGPPRECLTGEYVQHISGLSIEELRSLIEGLPVAGEAFV
jgi:hypothetical protein